MHQYPILPVDGEILVCPHEVLGMLVDDLVHVSVSAHHGEEKLPPLLLH